MDVPSGLGERGQALWEAMSGKDVPRNALVLEAARLADRWMSWTTSFRARAF